MKKRHFIFTLSIYFLLVTAQCVANVIDADFGKAKAASKKYAGQIVAVEGKHHLMRKFKRINLVKGMHLYTKDYIFCGSEGGVQIKLKDESVIKLKNKSKMRLNHFFQSKTKRKVDLKLMVGKVRCKVSKRFEKSNFFIKTPSAVAGVRGTDFVVESKQEGGVNSSSVSVLSGKVEVQPNQIAGTPTVPAKAVTLGAFQKTSVKTSEAPAPPSAMSRSEVNSIAQELGMASTESSGGDAEADTERETIAMPQQMEAIQLEADTSSQIQSLIENSIEQVQESIVEKNVEAIQEAVENKIKIGLPPSIQAGEGPAQRIGQPNALPNSQR